MHDPLQTNNLYKKGDVIGGTYEVCGLIGEGGCGIVYLAIHEGRSKPCALKTFRDEFLADARARKAFEKEALLWVHLDEHPFILSAHCVREFSGRLFVEMDYVPPDKEGRVSLNDHLRCGMPTNQERALEWAIQFCLGMEHAANHGITCHRDIKPANILIRNGAVTISDFGLAAAAEMGCVANGNAGIVLSPSRNGLSLTVLKADGKVTCGTPGYMPPEVFRGDGADVRSDIYSFGLVLWQIVTGNLMPPFAGAFRGDIHSFMRKAYERQMSGRLPATPEPLRAVVERCLKRDPSGRYNSFTELRKALDPLYKRSTGRVFAVPSRETQSAAFWNNKGISLAALGQHQDAISCYDKALALNPQEAKIWSNKGFALQELGWLEEALYCYEQALTLDPHLDGIWSNKATTLAALGRSKEAIACHNEGLALDSGNAAMWNNKADALSLQRRYKEAIVCLDKAIAIDPRYAEAWNNKGAALGSLGAHEDAIANYRRALSINPRYAEALYNIGLSFAALGQPREAIRFFDASLEIDPSDATVWFTKANQFDALECHEKAILSYDKALKLDPYYTEAWNNKGGTLVNMRRFREAVECYDAALAIDANDARRWFNKAYAEDQIGKSAACIKSYDQFLAMAPAQYAEQIALARRRVRELNGH
jgi:tetratricopeptide (TPR) repeat protein